MKTIGITTTVPIEVLLAAGYKVIDLNNLFVTASDYLDYIDLAERDGFPKSSCAWIKGIYGACLKHSIAELVGVVEGDCSNTKALIEVLEAKGIKVYPFSFPHSHSLEDVKSSIDKFMKAFNVDYHDVESTRKRLSSIRSLTGKLDELTYIEGKVTGFENHLYQVMSSDFDGDPDSFEALLQTKLEEFSSRQPVYQKLRLGYIGVPPMTCDLYEYVEKFGAHFVYNEVQREFTFPRSYNAENIYLQYYDYTYPYDIGFRLKEIKSQINVRRLDGIIHYTQAFCYRAIEDIIIKSKLDIPVLTIEGDKLNHLDSRTKLRLEAFLDMLSDMKEADL
ncbi:MAG: 2-hydroxyacyl-CoA dehydratase [Clostridia bacterium]|nr:2-hydroxyacyl-CoA dehydratase [Clostridia bacterium]